MWYLYNGKIPFSRKKIFLFFILYTMSIPIYKNLDLLDRKACLGGAWWKAQPAVDQETAVVDVDRHRCLPDCTFLWSTSTTLQLSTGWRRPDFTFLWSMLTTALSVKGTLRLWITNIFYWSTSTTALFQLVGAVDPVDVQFYCAFHHAPWEEV